MTARGYILFWSLTFTGFLAFVFLFKGMLLPFVLGIAVAYLLNPVVNKLGAGGLSRSFSALSILLCFLIAVLAFLAVLTPVLYKQLSEFALAVPDYADRIWILAEPFSKRALDALGLENGTDIKALVGSHGGEMLDVTQQILRKLGAGGQVLVDIISVMVFMPLVAYFMMKEWIHITRWVEDLLPQDHKSTIMGLLKEIDKKLSGFVRGQVSVAVFLGLSYAIALSLIGLKYGFLIGLSAGLLSIIPMVGSFIGLIVSVGVACFQWLPEGEWIYVAGVAGIFMAGQIIEGNILTPKLVGESVGLHPLWVFFALLAGGSLFGIVGMLLAVPVAAVAGVLIGFGLSQYKASPLYKGQTDKPKAAPPAKRKASVKKKKGSA